MKRLQEAERNQDEKEEGEASSIEFRNLDESEEVVIISDTEEQESCTPESREEQAQLKQMLRDRSNLKPPDRYANIIDVSNNHLCVTERDEPLSYRKQFKDQRQKSGNRP